MRGKTRDELLPDHAGRAKYSHFESLSHESFQYNKKPAVRIGSGGLSSPEAGNQATLTCTPSPLRLASAFGRPAFERQRGGT
jgi:hypothetical protein